MAFKIPEVITEEDMLKILKDKKVKKHHKFAFALGFYECMRISEVVKLDQESIHYDTKLLHIKQSKGSKDRMIPIAKQVLRGLKTHVPMRCGVRALQIAFNNTSQRILGRTLNFHILRHSGITYYITKKKWSTLEVQRLAGHSRVQTTQIYTHVNPTDLVDRMWEE